MSESAGTISSEEYRLRIDAVERYYDWRTRCGGSIGSIYLPHAVHAIVYLSNVIRCDRNGEARPTPEDELVAEDFRDASEGVGSTPIAAEPGWLESELAAWDAAGWRREHGTDSR